jgi:hypothetical protein
VPDEDNPEVEYLVAIEDEEEMNEIFSAYIQHLAQMQHA